MELKDFQKTLIDELSTTFLKLWSTGNYKLPLTFKAPTGSGKTIMMADFLRCLDDNYQFHEDKAYLWISFSPESYIQSKKKLYQYFNEGTDMHLKDFTNLNEEKLQKNNVFFINWQLIKDSTKEGRKLRKKTENTQGDLGKFDEFILNTKKERELILIVDEAHIEIDTDLSDELINLINPRVIIKVTATPKEEPSRSDERAKRAGFVEVLEEEVINSGLIKEKLIIQTEEDILKLDSKSLTEDEILLELAYNKREELKKHYEEMASDINPLVLIQLPSDFKEKEDLQENIKDTCLAYLNKKGVKEEEIAIWLSGNGENKKNLELIEKNNNSVNFMLFKVAPATGWDCPRAQVLVMYREINSPEFHTQIIGRVKRMPEAKHYENEELNKSYIYTNYNKQHIRDAKDINNGNKPTIVSTLLKEEVEQIKLETTFHKRTDFNTLEDPPKWQKCLIDIFDKEFKTSNLMKLDNEKELEKYLDVNVKNIKNRIIVDAEISSYDHFAAQLKEKAKDIDYHFSGTDVEKLYNLLCFTELKNQEAENAMYNPSRSWSPLKSALNTWFQRKFNFQREEYYKIIVNDLLKENSKLKKPIHNALIAYREEYQIAIKEKQEKEVFFVDIPEKENSFTDDFEELQGLSKNVYKNFYNKKEYKGKENEEKFIKFIDSQENVLWWHKQDDSGRNVFSVEYFNAEKNKNSLFNVDFIVLTKNNKLLLLDTKAGFTLTSQETADKNEALQLWIKANQNNYNFEIIGGIIKGEYPNWKINRKEKYIHANSNDWENLEEII